MSSTIDFVRIAYKVLFTLQIELDGYPDNINPFVKLIPDAPTEDFLGKYRIIRRKSHSGHVMLIETKPDGPDKGRPEIIPESDTVFHFELKMDRAFLSGTQMAEYNFTDNVLYVSNSVNHVVGTDILMSQPVPSYSSINAYDKGYLVRSGAAYYRAVQSSNSSDPHPVTDVAYWREISSGAFVSQADLRTRSSLSGPAARDTIVVIEVVHSAALAADYLLLDAALKCREVIYKVRLHR